MSLLLTLLFLFLTLLLDFPHTAVGVVVVMEAAAGAAVEDAAALVVAAMEAAAGAAVEDAAALILSLPPTLGNFGRNVNGRPCILGPHWLGTWLPALVFSCHRFIDISTLLW